MGESSYPDYSFLACSTWRNFKCWILWVKMTNCCSADQSLNHVFPRNLGFMTYGRRGSAIRFRWAFWHQAVGLEAFQVFPHWKGWCAEAFLPPQKAPHKEVWPQSLLPFSGTSCSMAVGLLCDLPVPLPVPQPSSQPTAIPPVPGYQSCTAGAVCAAGYSADPLSLHQAWQCYDPLQNRVMRRVMLSSQSTLCLLGPVAW